MPVAAGGVVIARLAPRPALQHDQQEHEAHHQRRELRRRRGVAEPEPGAEDAGGEGRHAEILHRAVVRQRLHQRQRQAGDHRRARQRQRDAEESGPGARAQGAADLEHADGLLQEGGARQQIHVGIQHQRQHDDGAAQRADLRKPVVTVGPAEQLAQPGLHRTGEIQHAGVGVGDDVGRHGHGQQQRPFEHAPARELAHGTQPGAGHAAEQGARAHAQQQQHRVGDVVLKDGVGRCRQTSPAGWNTKPNTTSTGRASTRATRITPARQRLGRRMPPECGRSERCAVCTSIACFGYHHGRMPRGMRRGARRGQSREFISSPPDPSSARHRRCDGRARRG
jgi:hypothetical protein